MAEITWFHLTVNTSRFVKGKYIHYSVSRLDLTPADWRKTWYRRMSHDSFNITCNTWWKGSMPVLEQWNVTGHTL